jgi:hypothetical protein
MKQQLMLVAMLSVGTALTTMGRLKPVAASLTPPAVYDYSYIWNATDSEQYLNVNGVDSIPLYTRTADGAYYDYVSTFNVIDGLSVIMDFQRSNSTWQASGTSYKPDEARIGSDSTVGSVSNKFSFAFNNQTNKDYKLFFDMSSTSGGRQLNYQINTQTIITWSSSIIWVDPAHMFNLYIPSYSTVIVGAQPTNTSSSYYFDGWYLKDLGVSAAYDAGYDDGYDIGEADGYEDGLGNNPNILINATESLIGMFVNFTFILFSLELFGVSILSVVGVLFGIVAIVWILKTIRG